jgi:large subunit ribosomal protein L16
MANIAPSRTKYRKVQKGRIRGIAKGGDTIAFGDFAIQSLTRGLVTSAQLESARVAITRHLKRKGKVWMRVFPHKPVSKKPAETRMGRGKGPVEYWAAVIKPGVILFEITGVSNSLAREAMGLADAKLPVHCRFLSREQLDQYL